MAMMHVHITTQPLTGGLILTVLRNLFYTHTGPIPQVSTPSFHSRSGFIAILVSLQDLSYLPQSQKLKRTKNAGSSRANCDFVSASEEKQNFSLLIKLHKLTNLAQLRAISL
jgi:hypothetical protein